VGIAADLGAAPPDGISDDFVADVLAAWPWLDIHDALPAALIGLYERNPRAASSNAVADACEARIPGFRRFNLCDRLVDKNHWASQIGG
jgi:hypothetical protein